MLASAYQALTHALLASFCGLDSFASPACNAGVELYLFTNLADVGRRLACFLRGQRFCWWHCHSCYFWMLVCRRMQHSWATSRSPEGSRMRRIPLQQHRHFHYRRKHSLGKFLSPLHPISLSRCPSFTFNSGILFFLSFAHVADGLVRFQCRFSSVKRQRRCACTLQYSHSSMRFLCVVCYRSQIDLQKAHKCPCDPEWSGTITAHSRVILSIVRRLPAWLVSRRLRAS